MHVAQIKMYGIHLPDIPPPPTCTVNQILEGAFRLCIFQAFLELFAFSLKEMVSTLCHLSLVPRERSACKLKR